MAESKKLKALKAICIGLSAYIVRAAIISVLGKFTSDAFFISVFSDIFIIIVGGLYYNYCIEPLGNRVSAFYNKKLPFSILFSVIAIVVFGFIVLRWFMYDSIFQSNKFILGSIESIQNGGQQESNLVFYCVYAVVFVPVAEEIIYRGFFFGRLYVINKPLAYCLSVLFFAVNHSNITQIIVAAFGGVLYSMLYVKTKSLRVCMAAHSLYNALALIIALLTSVFNLDNLSALYNSFAVSICAVIVIASLVLVRFAPVGLEIPRPKTLTFDEQAKRVSYNAEMARIFKEVEEEQLLEKDGAYE